MTRPGTSPVLDGERLFVSHLPEIERVIAWICARRHLSSVDADDFAAQVKLKLIENDYAVLRKFEGRSSMRTYLSAVIQRLYLDFRIDTWGKWRPSAEAKRCGTVAVLVERLITRDGHKVDEVYEILRTNHRIAITPAAFDTLIARLPPRAPRSMESDAALESHPSPLPSPDATAESRETQASIARVWRALTTGVARFDTQDRLILRMRFEDGCSVPQIAAALGLDQKPLYRRLDRLVRDLRAYMQTEGVEATAVRQLLADAPIRVEWAGESAGVSVHGK